MTATGIGKAVKRKEDLRFLLGDGQYTDDVVLPRQSHAYMLRSPHAHARIVSLDAEAARKMPGVIAIFTGEDIAAAGLGGIPCGWGVTDRHGQPMKEPAHPLLAQGYARHIGEAVAMVIAETRVQARDAAEAIEVDYEALPAVTGVEAALEPDAPKVHADLADNLCYDWTIGDHDATEAAFARATKVARIELVNNRVIAHPIETRAANAVWDRASDGYTLYTTSQNPHVIRLLMGAFVLQLPEHKLRVVAPDVGGGFGSKIYLYVEECLCTWAAKKVRRAVKWVADRSEAFLCDAHARDHVTRAEMAMDDEGNFLGLRVDTTANMGAYLSTFAPSIPTYFYALMFSGQYRTPAIHVRVRSAFTHSAPVDAYRGAGRSECIYVVERLVDEAARVAGLDPVEIRRRNFIPADGFPFNSPVGVVYDSGAFHEIMDEALKLADHAGFAGRRKASEAEGKLRGIGLSAWIESSGAGPSAIVTALGCRAGLFEAATLRVHPTGAVTVFTGAHSHGQGHETTFAQVVAEKFGLDVDQVEVVHGDTEKVPFGMGTYGSRSMAVGGGSVALTADKVIEKGKRIAAHLMECAVEDVVFQDATFSVAGTDKKVGWVEMTLAAHVPANYPLDQMEPCIEETSFYDPPNFTFPNGVFVCEVEIDRETGEVRVDRLSGVHDVGRTINPMIVDGQIHGGLAQAVGQALLENVSFDETGQLLSGSFMDYAMPRAGDVPRFVLGSHDVPTPTNPLGVKGAGEAGLTGAPAAIMNAVADALRSAGAQPVQMPATAARVWQALHAAH